MQSIAVAFGSYAITRAADSLTRSVTIFRLGSIGVIVAVWDYASFSGFVTIVLLASFRKRETLKEFDSLPKIGAHDWFDSIFGLVTINDYVSLLLLGAH